MIHSENLEVLKSAKGHKKYASLLMQARECLSVIEMSASPCLQFENQPKIDPKKIIQKQRLYSTKKKSTKKKAVKNPLLTREERDRCFRNSL